MESSNKDFIDKIEYKKAVALGVREKFKEIKKKAEAKHKDYTGRVSGMNDSMTNDYYRNISWEFSNFLADLDKEIADPLYHYSIPHDIMTILGKTKNKIVDILCPDKKRGTREYREELRKAGQLADLLEGFLCEAFMLGYGMNAQLTDEDKEKIDERWEKKTMDNMRNAYNAGSEALMLLLQARIADPNVDKDLKDRGL